MIKWIKEWRQGSDHGYVFGLQYNDVLEMLESFERMYLMSVYRKYRPDVPLHKHAKTWYVLSKKKITCYKQKIQAWSPST